MLSINALSISAAIGDPMTILLTSQQALPQSVISRSEPAWRWKAANVISRLPASGSAESAECHVNKLHIPAATRNPHIQPGRVARIAVRYRHAASAISPADSGCANSQKCTASRLVESARTASETARRVK